MIKILGDRVKIGSKPPDVHGKIIYACVTGMLLHNNEGIVACDLVGNVLAIFFSDDNNVYRESNLDNLQEIFWHANTSQQCAFNFAAKVDQWLLSKWKIINSSKYEITCQYDDKLIIVPILQHIRALRISIAGDLLIVGTSGCIYMYRLFDQKLVHLIYGDFSREFYICLHDAEFALIEAHGDDIYQII